MVDGSGIDIEEALKMLEIFASIGAIRLDLTLKHLHGEKRYFRRALRISDLRRDLPDLLNRCDSQQESIIVRPYAPPVFLAQLDDLDNSACQRIESLSLLQLETSPGNYQAWIAMSAADRNEDFARRLRQGIGADPTASGATRVAGSRNFKAKYAPDFPLIRTTVSTPGLLVSKDQLEALGLVAPAAPRQQPRHRTNISGPKQWPSYERCLRDAPIKHDHSGPDTSRADFTFCLIALDWGFGIEATAARLMEESSKARENGERYANLTAARAAEALAQRRQKPHNGP